MVSIRGDNNSYSWVTIIVLPLLFALVGQLFVIVQETRNDCSYLDHPDLDPHQSTKMKTTDAVLTKLLGALIYADNNFENENDNDSQEFEFDYNIVDVTAPSGTGLKLTFISWLYTKSFLSPLLLRYILDKNGQLRIRQLAGCKPYIQALPPTHYPVHQASRDQMQMAQHWNSQHYNDHLLLSSDNDENNNDAANGDDDDVVSATEVKSHSSDSNSNYRSIADYYQLYHSKKATPSEVMARLIEGVEHNINHLHVFSCFRPQHILEQAKLSDARWKSGQQLSIFDGVPIALKDQSPVAGLSICDGSSECLETNFDDIPAEYLQAAGAIVVGLTIMTEGGVTPLGYNAHARHNGPYNPHHTDYYCGGSSGGSAVAVAAGVTPMSVGWDGGGSIRIPAAMSGVIGLAPTFGRIPFERSNAATNIKAGPLASCMEDIALSYLLLGQVYNTTAQTTTLSDQGRGGHPQQRQRRRKKVFYNDLFGEAYLPPPHLTGVNNIIDAIASLTSSQATTASSSQVTPTTVPVLKGIRLGIFWDHFQHTDPLIYQHCLDVVEFLQSPSIGATIVNITIPFLREIQMSHGIKIMSEFGLSWETKFYNTSYHIEANTDITIKLGRTVTADEILAAEKMRTFTIRYVRDLLFERLQLAAILSPVMGDRTPKTPPGYLGSGESNVPLIYKLMRYVTMANFVGLPALSIPIGYYNPDDASENENENDLKENNTSTLLPIGFQMMGDAWNEHKLIQLGYIIEQLYLPTQYHGSSNSHGHATTATTTSTIRKPPQENYFDVLQPWLD